MLDEMKLPQSFTAMRTFVPLKDAPETRFVPSEPTGTRATFAIQLLFRQNTTWQGNLTWLEEGHTHSFASVLELLAFLQNVLSTLS